MTHHKTKSKARLVPDSTRKSAAVMSQSQGKTKPASSPGHISDTAAAAPTVLSADDPTLSNGQSINISDARDGQSPLLGEPLLLAGESKLDYEVLLADASDAVKPRNILEQVWVRDFVDHQWSILRLRRHAAALMNASKTSALVAVLKLVLPAAERPESDELASNFTMGDEAAIKKVEDILEKAALTSDVLLAEGTAIRIDVIERFDRMAVNAQKWRDAAVREIDRRRLGIGMIERWTVQEIEDEGYRLIQLCPRSREAA